MKESILAVFTILLSNHVNLPWHTLLQ